MILRMFGQRAGAKISRSAVWFGLTALLALRLASASTSPPSGSTDAAARATQAFKTGNLARIQSFLDETSSPGALDDYYFALIGDIQNSVRSLRHDVFNTIARDMRGAVDETTGEPLYDKIRFVILLGDLVYEGPSRRQWDALAQAFAGQAPEGGDYRDIARLAVDKPIFPAIGNHELLDFRFRTQTRFKDLFDSPRGAANLKSFFDWDRLIADPRVLYPVPEEVPAAVFREDLARLSSQADRDALRRNYAFRADDRYHLKFFDAPPLDEAVFAAAADDLAAELAPIFRRAGYGTLPVLSSDNMVHYAFEAGNVLYLFLDSMSRGWQYSNFARLKEALYPEKGDRHRLNLFSDSPFNGQAGFYRAAAAYAKENGRSLVVLLHHSFFNSSKDIHGNGTGYNAWLGLGFPQAEGDKGDRTVFDEILFGGTSQVFSACVHGFERFSIISRLPGREDRVVRWQISGGGGGPPRKAFYPERIKQVEEYFNAKLPDAGGPFREGSIEVRDDVTRVGHHYLIVHVRNGAIVDISPRFLAPEDLPRPRLRPQLALTTAYHTRPSSVGASIEFNPGVWSMEGVWSYLAFINWRPSVSLGLVDYNAWRTPPQARATALSLEISPLTMECHLPRANIVTLHLPGLAMWDGPAGDRRLFLTIGAEAPLIYDITGALEPLTFGLKAYIPFRATGTLDSEFGVGTRLALSVGYRIRL
jgi:hypothetical protein